MTHCHIAGEASQGLELLPHEAVANHDYALLRCALGEFLGIPWAQVALERPEHLSWRNALRPLHLRLLVATSSCAS